MRNNWNPFRSSLHIWSKEIVDFDVYQKKNISSIVIVHNKWRIKNSKIQWKLKHKKHENQETDAGFDFDRSSM